MTFKQVVRQQAIGACSIFVYVAIPRPMIDALFHYVHFTNLPWLF